ncbi:MAG: hypothetical protein UV04_C0034G0003 [Candidatus Gottesmanbacteria bacterium GW2011_GWA2_42_16]|nr:MAG: hypothetical protein UV04_C0034G0003 [Candidatus Gottesmanbacteria bacterium GW2011_GWA2_42_16]
MKANYLKEKSILVKNPELKNEQTLSKLGFLYDHLAFFSKNKILQPKYEQEALRLYNQALKYNPDSVSAIWGIGRIWWHRKNKKAIKYARRAARLAVKQDPELSVMYMNLAVVYETLGNLKRAEYWYRYVLKKEPNFFGAYYGLAEMYYVKDVPNKADKISKLLPQLIKLYKKESKKSLGSKFEDKRKKIINDIVMYVKKEKGGGLPPV